MDDHRGQDFSTPDQDNDDFYYSYYYYNCADGYDTGWWYSNCYEANLNGVFGSDDFDRYYYTWYPLQYSQMKIRPI